MMIANVPAITKLIDDNFDGNKTKFAETIGVERSFVSKVMRDEGKGAGAKFFGGVMRYCEKEGLDYRSYIFLSSSVNNINKANKQKEAS